MTSVLHRLSRADAKTERANLLASTGMTETALRTAGREHRLDAEQRGALSRINGWDWLMTGVSDVDDPCERVSCTGHDGHDGEHQPRERWWR